KSQPATSFTVQLLAAERDAALDELIKREHLQKDLARYSFAQGRQIIHVLTQGVYADRSWAEEATTRYSQAVKIWIRPIGDIHRFFESNPPPVPGSVPNTITADTRKVKDSSWVWSQDPEMVTIQLMAGGNRDGLEPYVRESLRVGVSAVIESIQDNKPWFILLHGHYKTAKEAQSAIANLHQQFQSAKPWVRSFASVHDELILSN
ncbi:MAG: hypothetical protein GQ470_00090, partial [Gammaproteobacteria bacterium]|nr:hypothetical protein [Gammaproteobacteria bacterium]